jgi:hypothetical protein
MVQAAAWLGLVVLAAAVQAQPVVFVHSTAHGANDGKSWVDAFVYLQDALASAHGGDEIWVAQGTYRPDQGDPVTLGDRSATFALVSGVKLFGGFSGTETSRDQRDWEAHETILSGDLFGNDTDNLALDEPSRSDNSFHVVRADTQVDASTMLDGFTIRSGHASDSGGGGVLNFGAGHFSNLVITANAAGIGGGIRDGGSATYADVAVIGNVAATAGGGMASYYSSALLNRVTFRGNVSTTFGGGFYNERSSVTVINTRFLQNEGRWGGGMYNRQGVLTLINGIFLGNHALDDGGGLGNDETETEVVNAVFSGNTAGIDGGAIYNIFPDAGSFVGTNLTISDNTAGGTGGGLHNWYGHPVLGNSILWGNRASGGTGEIFNRETARGTTPLALSHSIVGGGWLPPGVEDLGGNLNLDPLFVDAIGPDWVRGTGDEDLHLGSGSPAIDAGDGTALPSDVLDLDSDGDTIERVPVDLDYRVRVFDGGSGNAVLDMGAYEFDAPLVLSTAEVPQRPVLPDGSVALELFPVPFHEHATLRFTLRYAEPITITLHDAIGRRVRVLYQGTPAGGQTVTVPVPAGGMSSGTYCLRLIGAATHAARCLVLN